jgi:hypothetical protein
MPTIVGVAPLATTTQTVEEEEVLLLTVVATVPREAGE